MTDTEILFNPQEKPVDQRIETLKKLFPECFDKNGAFLSEKMVKELDAQSINTNREFYNLNWLGKPYAKLLKDSNPTTLLAEDITHNNQPQNLNSQNLLLKGDNLEVLKHLKYAYGGGGKDDLHRPSIQYRV